MTATIKSIEKTRMYKMIANELIDYIVSNQLQPGDTLPQESELSNLFDVSRTSVREGILYLETLGMVSSHKQGIVVNETDFRTIKDHLVFGFMKDEITWKELLDARKILEIGALELAIDQLRDEHFQKIEATIRKSKAKLKNKQSGVPEDLEFHQTILAATDNLVIEKFCIVLQQFFHNLPGEFKNKTDKQTIDEHEHIYECLKRKDKSAAIEALRRHLESAKPT